ncbi:MAG: DUF3320 domain-containing protein [Fimbriimonas sp.]
MPEHDSQVVARRLEEFRRNLLDPSLRNRQINFRTRTKAGKPLEKVVEVHGESPTEIYRILAEEGKSMSFVGKPDPRPPKKSSSVPADGEPGPPLAEEEEDLRDEEVDVAGSGEVDQTDLKLNTLDTVSALQRKLTKIHREAKEAIEEQGVNFLHLSLGSLQWYESEASEEERRAPLLLLPVSLERTNSGSFRLKWDGGDLGGNLSIAAKLKAEFGIRLPELPEEPDVATYLEEVRNAVRGQRRWSVDGGSVALAFFSYAKYLMYRDLDAAGWPEESKPLLHETLGALLDSGFEETEPGIGEEEFLDPLRPTQDICEVYDADGSQTIAILEANTGRSMLIEGPPGTGKSQTITNLIAEFVGAGKKVLFVAEKAAALDVVFRRLRAANLGDACLELHSNKANKGSFYAELQRTIAESAPKSYRIEAQIKRLEESKAALTGYSNAVNTPVGQREITPRHAIGRLITLPPEESPDGRHDFARMASWRETDFRERLDLVAKLQAHVAGMGRPVDHPYFGCTLDHLLPQDKADIAWMLEDAGRATETLHSSADALAEALRVELPVRPADVDRLRSWAQFVAHAPDVRGVAVGRSDWDAVEPLLRDRIRQGRRLNELRANLAASVSSEAYASDLTELRNQLRLVPLIGDAEQGRDHRSLSAALKATDAAAAASYELQDAARGLALELGVPVPTALSGIEPLAALAKRIGSAPDLRGIAVADSDWPGSGPVLEEALEAVRRFQDLRSRYSAVLNDAAWAADVGADLEIIERHGSSVLRVLNGGFRAAMARSATNFKSAPKSPAERCAALRAVVEARQAEQLIAKHRGRCSALFGQRWDGTRTNASELSEAASWIQEMHSAVASGKVPIAALAAIERGADPARVGELGDRLRVLAHEAVSAVRALCKELSVLPPAAVGESGGEERVYVWLTGDLRSCLPALKSLVPGAEKHGFGGCLGILDLVAEAQLLRSAIEESAALAEHAGSHWAATGSDWDALETVLNWTLRLHASVSSGDLPAGLVTFFAEERPRGGLDAAVLQAQEDRKAAQDAVKKLLVTAQLHDDPAAFTEEPIASQRSKIEFWKQRLDDLPSLIRYNALAAEAARMGLTESVELADSWPEAGSRLAEAFERTWYTGVIREAVVSRPEIAHFDRANHEEIAAEFRLLDNTVLQYNRAKVALSHWRTVPRQSAGGAIGWLKLEMAKKKNHKPIRSAMERAGDAVQAIKPVFLMSPLSVAMYLPPAGPRFDVVIFDEASQVKPEDAFGGILRAQQTIVVGDSKQMPPTSFFDKLTSEEVFDEDEEDDDQLGSIKELESVLAMMSAKVAQRSPRRRDLRWHYRSHHDGLIATSNRLFYKDRLVVFPSPWRSGANGGLVLRHDPTTVYGRGGSRKNLAEARAVALAALKHAREHPNLTLGIAAFSKAQQEAILDELDVLRKEDPALNAFDAQHPFEKLFVKNLENVQGDERDVIFISVGYGRDENGFISASFGPLNRPGGERRLNVLITRARVRCDVFTNILEGDVRISDTSRAGVRALKTFLAFADTGSLDVPAETGLEPQSPFEEAVLAKLRAHGYDTEPQVGSCGFFIDMAIRHPAQPQRFVLGIECDGAMYHSARSARDRDKLRQAVLEQRGWRMHRIWSTDWFQNPEREFGRLVQAIESAIVIADEEREAEAEARNPFDFVELERDEAADLSDGVEPYTVCELSVDLRGGQLHEQPTSILAIWVALVVEAEAPVHIEEVTRRIREGAGVGRAGTRIQSAIERAIDLAERQGRAKRSGDFLHDPNATAVKVRSRSDLASQAKRLELVCPEEISAALVRVAERSFGIDPEEAYALTAKMLGFDRTTAQMAERIQRCLEDSVAANALRIENGLIRAVPAQPAERTSLETEIEPAAPA